MPFIELEGRQFFFVRRGVGPALLLIGGTGGDLRRPETQFGSPLQSHFDLLSYDQRGMGQSYKGEGPFTMADYADDAARLMEAVGWSDALVMGISFGGMVAQELVLRHPHKVRRLVLCCTASGGAGGASFPYHQLPAMDAQQLAILKVRIADVRHDETWGRANPESLEMLCALAAADPFRDEPGHAEGARRQLAARATHDTWERLASISCPVLILGGRYDGIAEPAVMQALADRIPRAHLRFFEGGHFFLSEDKAAYPAIIDFFGG
jgi:3-oxoadipate enol-lactonase